MSRSTIFRAGGLIMVLATALAAMGNAGEFPPADKLPVKAELPDPLIMLDGTKVTMYAQWRSVETYQAMRENPDPLPYLQKALAIAKFEPGIYEVVETFSAAAADA